MNKKFKHRISSVILISIITYGVIAPNLEVIQSYSGLSMIDETINKLIPIKNEIKNSKEKKEKKEKKRKEEKKMIENSVDIPLCAKGKNVKSYMDGSTVTNQESDQYKLLKTMHINHRGNYETDDGFIGVAFGSYYGPVGTKYIVDLDSGIQLKVIKADEKADEHVNNGCVHKIDESMMEMIIDEPTAAAYYGMINGYVLGGNFNNSPDYQGNIIRIRKVEQ